MILDLIQETVTRGARLKAAADILGLSARTIIRWQKQNIGTDKRKQIRPQPFNKLSQKEREQIIAAANSPQYRDMSPKQIVPRLADEGTYIGSESSFYRILKEHNMMNHRHRCKPATHHRPMEHEASGPCQIWSWDITYLCSSVRGKFFYLYLFLDVWSRKIMAATVFEQESMEHSARMFNRACFVHGVNPRGLILHSDNGGPMKGSTMLATLQRLGVVPSFSRPKVSDDNPYSEALFRTLKYRPEYPSKSFETIKQAQKWVDHFVRWYNTSHLHSSIRFITPDDRHYGRENKILANRIAVYQKAQKQNPERWSGHIRNWTPVHKVWLNPENRDQLQINHLFKEAA